MVNQLSEETKLGRPEITLDWKKIDDLLICGCSGRQIAGHIGINPNTLYERCVKDNGITFTDYSQQFYAKGESLLVAQQFLKAIGKTTEGDNTMLIWLGKQRLDQKENKDNVNNQQKVVFEVNYKNDNNNPVEISPKTLPAPDTASTE